MAILSPVPKLQFFDNNGDPLVGGRLFSYQAGTTSPIATYTDSTESSLNTNPIILDSRGEASVWLGSSSYKLKLQSAVGVDIWTVDNVNNASIIGTSDIADSAVTTAKIANSSVTTAKLNSALLLPIANGGTGATTAATALTALGAQAALGYTPVQNGTGVGQSSNVIKIGWSGTRLKATVDVTDLGNLLFDSNFGNALGYAYGYQRIGVGGLIIQWGNISYADVATTLTIPVTYPISFPTITGVVMATADTSQYAMSVTVNSRTNSGCNIVLREGDIQTTGGTLQWMAIGF